MLSSGMDTDLSGLALLQRLERILNDVKSIYGTHESAETRKLYDLFGAFGGPVQVALELLKATDCRTVKVYQALSDIVSCNLYHLTCKLGPSHDAVRSYADLTYQWEQLLKLAPHHVQLTLTDNFQGLIRELQAPTPSLERLEMVVRRVRFFLDFQVPMSPGNAMGMGMMNLNLNDGPRAITPPQSSKYSTPYSLVQSPPQAIGTAPQTQTPGWVIPMPAGATEGSGGPGPGPGLGLGWLSKAELPRRPFKSRECDFYKQGKCNKEVCNFAHGNAEVALWSTRFQAMMPCKTPACLGRANGCIFAHNPDEQTHSRREYEDLIGQATQRDMEPAFSPFIVTPASMIPRSQWLPKNDLPRPFRSKMCDYLATQGICNKDMCNYAHNENDQVVWSGAFQTMFRCNTKGCVGRAGGCTFSHTPEEQLISRAKYEEDVEHERIKMAQEQESVSSTAASTMPHSPASARILEQ